MSGTPIPAAEFASATVDNFSTQASELTAPILRIVPYATFAFSLLRSTFSFIWSLCRPLLHLSPLPIILYVLAPLIVFLDIVVTIFVRAPYRTIAYLLEVCYPLYVFCGVACITGALLGLLARGISSVIVAAVSLDDEPSVSADRRPQEEEPKPDLKGKGRKLAKARTKVKIES